MINIELQDVLKVVRQIRNNDYNSGTHYLLGYLWANTSDKEKTRIAKLFAKDLEELGKNKC